MASMNSTFFNGYGEIRPYVILDIKRDPNTPLEIFREYLNVNQSTNPLQLYSAGISARVTYQRSDGAPTNIDNISHGDAAQWE